MTLLSPLTAYIRAMEETGPSSILSKVCEHALSIAVDFVDYDALKNLWARGQLEEPPDLDLDWKPKMEVTICQIRQALNIK